MTRFRLVEKWYVKRKPYLHAVEKDLGAEDLDCRQQQSLVERCLNDSK